MHDDLIRELCEAGFLAYIVGGAARDMLLGQTPEDVDICTNASPEEICKVFKDHKVSDVDGTTFRVVLVDGIEIAQFRRDIPEGLSHKNCATEPAKDLIQDLERRDLTCNSFAICPFTGDIIDPFNGRQDLKNKIIRFTGDPDRRIWEDPCRVLRACRFLAKLGPHAQFHEESMLCLARNIGLVKEHVAPERIRLEILKSMKVDFPSVFFEALHMIGLLEFVLPTLARTVAHEHGLFHPEDVFEHVLRTGDFLPKEDPILRLTGYLHDVGKPISWDGEHFIGHEKTGADAVIDDLKRLKFTNDEIKRIYGLIRMHMRSSNEFTPKVARRYLKRFVELDVSVDDWLLLKEADRHGNMGKEDWEITHVQHIVNIFDEVLYDIIGPQPFSIKDLAIDGNDVMKFCNIKPGKQVGDTLKRLLDLVIDNPEMNTREILLKSI